MIYKNKKNGSFYFRTYVYDMSLCKKVQKTRKGFATKAEARLAEKEFIKSYSKPMQNMFQKEEKKLLFKDAFKKFYDNEIQQLKESSKHGLYQKLDKNILKFFKNYDVKKIEPQVILTWYSELNKKDLSTVYKNNMLNYLKKIFKFINLFYGINNAYVQLLKSYKNNKVINNETKIYTEAEFLKFASKIKDPFQ